MAGCNLDRKYKRGFLAGLELDWSPNFTVPTAWAAIKSLSSDRIMAWWVYRSCSFTSSFTSRIQICNPTDIRWVAVKQAQIWTEIWGFLMVTSWILVVSQIWKREVKERLKLHNLHTDHVMIRSELKYLFGSKDVWLKCRVFGGKTGPIAMVRVFVW